MLMGMLLMYHLIQLELRSTSVVIVIRSRNCHMIVLDAWWNNSTIQSMLTWCTQFQLAASPLNQRHGSPTNPFTNYSDSDLWSYLGNLTSLPSRG